MVRRFCVLLLGSIFLAGCQTVPIGPTPEETVCSEECGDSAHFRSRCAYGRKGLVGRVHFDFDGAKVSEGDRQALKSVALELNNYPERGVLLAGFYDGKGKEDYNLSLCQKRIEAVAEILQSEGVVPSRMKGEPRNVAAEPQPGGQAKLSRRVDILFR
ncbi:MAG: OmpA family protein [Puniceicoccales bacterium]|jgi:outer membrane protein OmpA-like peptidoglycan-associated protein|nr:OmpA family protein [Puniceicoccales bacterium]